MRSGEIRAPVVIGRDHLDSGSVASPYRETEGMRDGSDAIADWPVLNAMLNVASGAAWVALHHGGGVGIGRSIHSGAQVVADGTDDGAFRRRARAHERSGHRRDAARGRRLRDRDAHGARARRRHPHAGMRLAPDLLLAPDGRVREGLAVRLEGGRVAEVLPQSGDEEVRLPRRLLVPGIVNAHSHAFQRDLRGRVEVVGPEGETDDFWTWREEMYAAAASLGPARMHDVGLRCFREARAAGYTAVGSNT